MSCCTRLPLRRRVLCGGHDNENLLPPRLHRTHRDAIVFVVSFSNAATRRSREGFRPCLRMSARTRSGSRSRSISVRVTARVAAERIEAGALNNGGSIEKLAKDLGLSSRSFTARSARNSASSPVELAQTKRLLLAKQLLTETDLPIIEVAFTSGFESMHRFNALFRTHYRLTPSTHRRRSVPSPPLFGQRAADSRFPAVFCLETSFALPCGPVDCGRRMPSATRPHLRTVEVGSHRGWLPVRTHSRQKRSLESR